MLNSKPVGTPVKPDIKLVSGENPDYVCNQQMYQAVVWNFIIFIHQD